MRPLKRSPDCINTDTKAVRCVDGYSRSLTTSVQDTENRVCCPPTSKRNGIRTYPLKMAHPLFPLINSVGGVRFPVNQTCRINLSIASTWTYFPNDQGTKAIQYLPWHPRGGFPLPSGAPSGCRSTSPPAPPPGLPAATWPTWLADSPLPEGCKTHPF